MESRSSSRPFRVQIPCTVIDLGKGDDPISREPRTIELELMADSPEAAARLLGIVFRVEAEKHGVFFTPEASPAGPAARGA